MVGYHFGFAEYRAFAGNHKRFRYIVFNADPGYKALMSFRGIAVIMASIWLAVNLLGCLASDNADLHIASTSVVATNFDTPDDLKHQSVFFPLPTAVYTTYNSDSLLKHQQLTLSVSTEDSKSHRVSRVLLL